MNSSCGSFSLKRQEWRRECLPTVLCHALRIYWTFLTVSLTFEVLSGCVYRKPLFRETEIRSEEVLHSTSEDAKVLWWGHQSTYLFLPSYSWLLPSIAQKQKKIFSVTMGKKEVLLFIARVWVWCMKTKKQLQHPALLETGKKIIQCFYFSSYMPLVSSLLAFWPQRSLCCFSNVSCWKVSIGESYAVVLFTGGLKLIHCRCLDWLWFAAAVVIKWWLVTVWSLHGNRQICLPNNLNE